MGPKILFLDIETTPDLVYTWGGYEQNALHVKEHWRLLSYSAKWRGGKHVTRGWLDAPEKQLVEEVWKLLDEADIVLAHNGIDFDIKKLNARFIAYGMQPPAPFRTVDTKRGIRAVAAFSSNKLDWLCQQLGLGKKLEHEGIGLWLRCMAGDKASWKKMLAYNRHDVVLLEQLYETIAPWIKQPNANMWTDRPCCPNPACGSKRIMSKGYARSEARLYKRWVCLVCGTPIRSTISERDVKATLVSMNGGTIA